jgi:adenine deaminase
MFDINSATTLSTTFDANVFIWATAGVVSLGRSSIAVILAELPRCICPRVLSKGVAVEEAGADVDVDIEKAALVLEG